MINIDTFILALKASWVEKLKHKAGKWSTIFKHYVNKLGFNEEYIWKTSFRDEDSFPIIGQLPDFYQDVIIAFNTAKPIKQFKLLNPSEIAQLPLWGSDYFKIKSR